MDLRESIEAAFNQVPYPGDDAIAMHECPECRDIRRDFRGQSPWTLNATVLERRYDSLPLLGPHAYQYFLPAYMIYSIGHPDSLLARFTRYSLAPSDFDEHDRQRFELFTASQKASIIALLEFMKTHTTTWDDGEKQKLYDNLNAGIEIWKSTLKAQQAGPAYPPQGVGSADP